MNKRRIPTDKQWFDYRHNKFASWLYCFMISSATYNDKLYYPKRNFSRDLPLIKKFLGVSDKRTITKYINQLKSLEYLAEDNENYYFPFQYNTGTYILINRDLLYNLCITKSTITTQIFVYLMDRLKMKQKLYAETSYNFTIKELRVALGYSEKTQNATIEKAINECLMTLKAEQYIDYTNTYVDITTKDGRTQTIPNYVLTYVCETIPQRLDEIKQEQQRTFNVYSSVFVF